jgi:hypothetical protein
MHVVNRANLSPTQLAVIESELFGQQNLNDVMQWALADKSGAFIPGVVADVIIQDEFTHDVIVPWCDGLFLVFDAT